MQILIGADIVPTKSNEDLFIRGDAETLVGADLLAILELADYRIFNLEVPLCDKPSPIEKCGPALIAPTASITGYQALGIDCLTLANNHIMDQGTDGFFSTAEILDQANITHVGGGKTLEEAIKPLIIEKAGKKIGIYACAEHEFSIADETTPGANPFDPLESLDHVSELKKLCDFVIVLYHGGKEHYRYPSPYLQKVCRKLVDKGADLVVCQHSHCIGCEEKYQNGTIVYGQGNFLFDHSNSEFWQTSLLIHINDDFTVSYIPLQKQENTVRMAQGESARKILNDFTERSREIWDSKMIQKKYSDFAKSMHEYYLLAFSTLNTKNLLFRIVNKITGYRFYSWLLARKYSRKKELVIQNFTECEAHRELMTAAIKNKT